MKTILITGGAGFIGQQFVKDAIAKDYFVVVVDLNESIGLEMQQTYGKDKITCENFSMVDKIILNNIFSKYKPEVVIHAAAHKHVSMVEKNPQEAMKNNILGTINVFDCCIENNVKKCIYISTDKADEPTSVYGVTKQVGEKLLETYSKFNLTQFMAVRFCNVRWAPGSVLPLFKRQIDNNQPITVTDKRMRRYFIDVEQASTFVYDILEVGTNGSIYMLDVGEDTNIYDMAREMCIEAGKPDLEIIEIGALPGERLTEPYVIGDKAHIYKNIYQVK